MGEITSVLGLSRFWFARNSNTPRWSNSPLTIGSLDGGLMRSGRRTGVTLISFRGSGIIRMSGQLTEHMRDNGTVTFDITAPPASVISVVATIVSESGSGQSWTYGLRGAQEFRSRLLTINTTTMRVRATFTSPGSGLPAFIGNTEVTKAYVGSTEITKMYVGSSELG